MAKLTLRKIDKARKKGFRPGVVGVFVNNKEVLLFYKSDWDLWLFPQGGIRNKELAEEALVREMNEEVAEGFSNTWQSEPVLIFEDRIRFRKALHNKRDLVTDSGEHIPMIGKQYFYFLVEVSEKDIDIDDSEFDDYRWVSFDEAVEISTQIYQKNKKKALIKVLNILLKNNFID